MQILDLSKRYIKALAEENQGVMDGPYVGTMTAYGETLRLPFLRCTVKCSSDELGAWPAPRLASL